MHNSETDQGPAWGRETWGPKEHCIARETRFLHGFDAAFAKFIWPLVLLTYSKNIDSEVY